MLIYRLDEGLPSTRLVLMDRRGQELQTIADAGSFRQPRFSPDMIRMAAERSEPRIGRLEHLGLRHHPSQRGAADEQSAPT